MKKKEKLKVNSIINHTQNKTHLDTQLIYELGLISDPQIPNGNDYLITETTYKWYSYSWIKPDGDDGKFLPNDKVTRAIVHHGLQIIGANN